MSQLVNRLLLALCSSCALFFAGSTLIAAPVWIRPSSQPVRMFVAFWLLYCIVVNVAYQVGAPSKPWCLHGHSPLLAALGSLWCISSSNFFWACLCLICYIWSIALYGAETWTLRAVDQKQLESFEMW
jgi:hypothetical protein